MRYKVLTKEQIDSLKRESTEQLKNILIEATKRLEGLKAEKERDTELNALKASITEMLSEWREAMQGPKETIHFCVNELFLREKNQMKEKVKE